MLDQKNRTSAVDWSEIFHPRPVGERVNPHVTTAVKEPELDFDEMRRFVEDPDYSKLFSR